MAENMDLYETRLATFQGASSTGGKRASTTKGGKAGKWALKSPSAEQLAQAGFYFAPTGVESDNVTCFCCNKSLDGWEEGDNAFSEHVHFSSECAWAILMAIENDADETLKTVDPMSDKMVEARRQTFKDQWPHEKKRGWTCKVQKMVDGGWYFSPSPEGDDQANCVYCKKSLWGWEPKDKPYDEHKKRSPACVFFSSTQGKPSAKGRKGRVSKASRMSNQSIATVSIDESNCVATVLDDTLVSTMNVDASTVSTSTKTKKTTRGKKGATKSTRSKNVSVNIEAETFTEEVPAPPGRATRGKKRTSEQMLADSVQVTEPPSQNVGEKSPEDSVEVIEPPKKRATRARNSTAKGASRDSSLIAADIAMEEAEFPAVTSKKGGRGGRKRASSTTRKPSARTVSAQSTTSQASLRAASPGDDEIDAALQADLARFESDDESDNWKVLGKDDSVVSQIYNPQTRVSATRLSTVKTKGKKNASVIKSRSDDIIVDDDHMSEPVSAIAAVKKAKAKPGRKAKKIVSKDLLPEPESVQSLTAGIKEFEASLEADDQHDFESVVEYLDVPKTVEQDVANKSQTTAADDSGHETDGSILAQNKAKRVSKKGKGGAKAKQTNRKASSKQKNTTKKSNAEHDAFQIPAEIQDADVAEEMHQLEKEYQDVALSLTDAPTPMKATGMPGQTKSPEASLQGSDAENQPPSSRPSQSRPPLARYSPTGARTVRIALAPSTPTASSKHNARLESTYPWAPADIEYILTGTPAVGRENVDLGNLLNSAEGKMTVEEWINFNARKNEDKLKAECERMVGKFESEGVRALKTLEGVLCSD